VKLAVYCHCYLVKDWSAVLAEVLAALEASTLYREIDALRLGLVGEREAQAACVAQVRSLLPVEVVAAVRLGWEQTTLFALWQDARTEDWDYACYVHTKGVSAPSAWNNAWRRSMLAAVIGHWPVCVGLLAEVDCVGCHWLSPEAGLPYKVDSPYFGGNMWWSTRKWIASLDPPLMDNRHEAEAWLGRNRPTVADLAPPGWPSPETLFRPAHS
jgi:hypothetical protein